MRNPMTKLEDAVREAPSMADTRHIIPQPLKIISSIGVAYQSRRARVVDISRLRIFPMKDAVSKFLLVRTPKSTLGIHHSGYHHSGISPTFTAGD
jgi:hypothetical protein